MKLKLIVQALFGVMLLVGIAAIFWLPFSVIVTGPSVAISAIVLIILWKADI